MRKTVETAWHKKRKPWSLKANVYLPPLLHSKPSTLLCHINVPSPNASRGKLSKRAPQVWSATRFIRHVHPEWRINYVWIRENIIFQNPLSPCHVYGIEWQKYVSKRFFGQVSATWSNWCYACEVNIQEWFNDVRGVNKFKCDLLNNSRMKHFFLTCLKLTFLDMISPDVDTLLLPL